MGKKFSGVSQTMSRFRGWIQAGATLLTNLHLQNFLKGGLYQGAGKTVCVPGLNCYSCPAASGACPIGAFQAVVLHYCRLSVLQKYGLHYPNYNNHCQ